MAYLLIFTPNFANSTSYLLSMSWLLESQTNPWIKLQQIQPLNLSFKLLCDIVDHNFKIILLDFYKKIQTWGNNIQNTKLLNGGNKINQMKLTNLTYVTLFQVDGKYVALDIMYVLKPQTSWFIGFNVIEFNVHHTL